jgi:hypothetical protein
LYRKKSSGWAIAAGVSFFRRQKNQSEKMKEMMSATPPPTAPPTMAPKLRSVEGAAVSVGDEVLMLVGVLVDDCERGVGVGVTESADTVGVLVANAP